jgi:hypothetical protein
MLVLSNTNRKPIMLTIEILMMLDELISCCKLLPSDVNKRDAITASEISFVILHSFAISHRYYLLLTAIELMVGVGRSKGPDMAECKSSTSAMFVMAFELSKINASSAFEFRIATLALSVL